MVIDEGSKKPRPLSLFSLYAPEDALSYKRFEKHLSALKAQYCISLYSVETISPGADREAEIERYLNEAQIILFFVSSDFTSSHYRRIVERALKRKRETPPCFVPIKLRAVDVEGFQWSCLQALPANGPPIIRWRDKDEAFLHITRAIRRMVQAQIEPTAKSLIITEDHRSYLRWLIKRVSALDIPGVPSHPRGLPVTLEEIYIPLVGEKDDENPHEPRAPGEEPLGETSPLLLSEVVLRHRHVLLLGEPGSGKTTCLRYLALQHAQALCNGAESDTNESWFPIVLRLADYVEHGMHRRTSLRQYLLDDGRAHGCPVSALGRLLHAELQAGRCLVLVDGFDEVMRAEDRREAMHRLEEFVHHSDYGSNRFLLTSRSMARSEAALRDTFVCYRLQKLGALQIQRFLETWCPAVEAACFPETAETIRSIRATQKIEGIATALETHPALRQLATTPLLLRILVQLYQVDVPLPRQRVAVYDQIVSTLLQNWHHPHGMLTEKVSKKPPLRDQLLVRELLSGLGFWLHTEKPGGGASEYEIAHVLGKLWASLTNRQWTEEDGRTEEAMKQCVRAIVDQTGLLVEDPPGHYRFTHLTFEDYFVACSLIANRQDRAKRIREHMHDPCWQEAILLALGLVGMQAPEEAHQLVQVAILAQGEEASAQGIVPDTYESLLGRDFLFALRCLGEDIPVHPSLAEELIERLHRELATSKGFERYQQALAERLAAVETSTYASLLLPYFFRNLEGTDLGLRLWSLFCLGRIRCSSLAEKEQVCQRFLEMLCDENPQIRQACLQGLSRISGAETTHALLEVVRNDENAFVRRDALRSLMQRQEHTAQVTETLLEVLQEKTLDVQLRQAAVTALGEQADASPRVISTLIALLQTENARYPDGHILESLCQLSQRSAEVVPMMVSALQDALPETLLAVARAMETFGHVSPKAKETVLLSQLRVPEYALRLGALHLLRQLEELSEDGEAALQAYLSDGDSRVRTLAAEILCAFEMSSETLILLRERLMAETDDQVRVRIVQCLGEADGPPKEMVSILLQAMDDRSDPVREWAVRSLGQSVPITSTVLSALLSALDHDPSSGVRWGVVQCFQHLSTFPKRALPSMVRALNDEHRIIREDCAHLLGQCGPGNQSTIRALVRGLSDKEMSVRKACSQALVLLGQRFPERKETILMQLERIVRTHQQEAISYGTPGDLAYEAFWLLAQDGSLGG